jgi:biotin carboxyl carrier protein
MCDVKIDMNNAEKQIFEVSVDGEKYKVEVTLPSGMSVKHRTNLINNTPAKAVPQTMNRPTLEPQLPKGEQGILAPMPGNIISYEKNIGDKVKMGDSVVVLEAMKMYNNLYAPCDGVIKELAYKAGDNVKKYDVLCVIEELRA